ncbi:hypothetical protein [Haloferula sp.]|uniref:WD40/YVTN/BNR-like repeat-containing protein n=1 Tax=Haloferula sp. TaxID=2497595 RepID=UPI00329F4B8C
MPIRSEEEHTMGLFGGEAEQHPHGITRCLSHPDVIYWSHDIGGVWRSDNAGRTWRKTVGAGLPSRYGQSIEVDPDDPETVFIILDNSFNWLLPDSAEGLYRSRDGGDSFIQVLSAPSIIYRIHRHNIAFDAASRTVSGATRWYAVFPDHGLYRSDDSADTWALQSDLTGHTTVYTVETHPSDGETVYVATSLGLFSSSDQGAGLASLGDLPAGSVSSVQVHPETPNVIYAVLRNQGLYRSTDSGRSFSLLRSFNAGRLALNPGHPDTMYLSGISGANTITSHDGGQSWITDMVTLPAPGLNRAGDAWKAKIEGALTGIVPNPTDPEEAVAYSRGTMWKTTDGGQTFFDSSTLFTGYSASWGLRSMTFDRFDSDRFALFNNDVGMTITENLSEFFDRRNDQAAGWRSSGEIEWLGTYSGDFQPIEGSEVIVASIGNYFRSEIMRSANAGESWTLVTDEVHPNYFVSFHPDDPDVVYAGNKISLDAGLSFSEVDFGTFNSLSPEIVGMCRGDGDTIYAMDASARNTLLRSDDRGVTWYQYAKPGWNFRWLDSYPSFEADPENPDKVYTLDSGHDLAIFDGSTWTSTGVLALAGGETNGNFVRRIAVDPTHPEVVYAGLAASGVPCVFRSVDGGATWVDITGNSPQTGSDAIQVNPHTGELFRGTGSGNWIHPPPSGFAYASTELVYDKQFDYATIETPPSLKIEGSADGEVTISWSPDAPTWKLQQSPSLNSPDWMAPAEGSANPLTLPATEDRMFFRLDQ